MNNEKLLKIINHYGLKAQLKHLHTEHYELDEACLLGQLTCNKEHVAEELADMFVMLFQIKEYFDISDEQIDEIMEHKIERQLKRIEDEQNANK